VTVDDASSEKAPDTAKTGVSEEDFVALAPGKTIGRYEIVAVLGQGGFGITYRARDAQLGREVAIKEYLPSALAVRQDGATVLPRSTKVAEDFAWGRQRFVDEGRTLATLQRAPGIVRVFDFLEVNGTAYIVMELLEGDTLESRLRRGPLTPPELDRILWPLLDGLEQVHATGFLHRDIKPANILLDAAGNPTLIDFGASRAAMAGRTAAMTAIFTPGYAAAEQMTSAKQGPWTDIYGLAATMYHAITGHAPVSSFDRMLDDEYVPLGQIQPAGFSPGLLVGIDAGLAVRASDRPQSIAGWRPILGHAGPLDAQATVALGRPADPNATVVVRQPTITPTITPATAAPPPAAKGGGKGVWIGLAALLILALGGGGYWYATRPPLVDLAAQAKAEADAKAKAQAEQAEAARVKQQEAELAKLREEKARRDQEAHDAEIKRQAAEAERQRIQAEEAAREKADAEAKAQEAAKQAAAEAEKQKALEKDKAHAMEAEAGLHLGPLDRQHVQVALTALGFNTNGTDGVFGQHTHDMIAAWQKSHSYPDTGYLTGPENQELLRAASAAVTKFDDDQKKADDEKKKADEAKAKAAAAAPPPTTTTPAPQTAAAAPPVASGSPDGIWTGTYQCGPNNVGGGFNMPVRMAVQGGHGFYTLPVASPTQPGNHSVEMTVKGKSVFLQRTFVAGAGRNAGSTVVTSLNARFEGGTITGTGTESQGGRSCNVILTR
jgi:peptidoglycan hydrolase-like protein with peptidoglycan-binding domain